MKTQSLVCCLGALLVPLALPVSGQEPMNTPPTESPPSMPANSDRMPGSMPAAMPGSMPAAMPGSMPGSTDKMPSDMPGSTAGMPGSGDMAMPAAEERIDVDFRETPIRDIIRQTADLLDLNVVIPQALEGIANLKLKQVTWRNIFDQVLDPVGYTYVVREGIIRVISRADLNAEPTRTEVIRLQFARANEVSSLITPMLGGAGERVQVVPSSNSIILTVGPTKSAEIKPIIDRLDNDPGDARQVMIDSKFVEVNVTGNTDVGVDWNALSDFAFNSVAYDGGATAPDNPDIIPGPIAIDTVPAALFGNILGGKIQTAVFSSDQFSLVLRALQATRNVRLVSNPSVVSLTNQEAEIKVTTKFPIILTTNTPSASGSQNSETKEEEEYGITLKVTPQIRPQSIVSLEVTPTVSNLDGFNIAASGNRYPIISERTVTNRVNLKDGYTIALGGLLSTQTTEGRTKVPLLGDAPFIGNLFRQRRDEETTRNLIVFITTRIIDAGGLADPANNDNFDELVRKSINPDAIRALEIERTELPGFMSETDPYIPPGDREQKDLADRKKGIYW